MSQIARISSGVKAAALRNLPSIMFFNEQSVVSSTTHLLGGLPTTNSNSNSNWVKKKKSNFWNLAPQSFFNPDGIINHRPLFSLPCSTSSKPFTTTTTSKDKDKDKDKEGGTSKGLKFQDAHKEKLKILKVLLDYDKPHYHLVNGVKVLSMVLQEWKKLRPNYELDYYKVDDLVNLNTSRLYLYMVVDENLNTGNKISIAERTILRLLSDYDDPKFADQVLFEAMYLWNVLTSDIEVDCINLSKPIKDKHGEEVKYPIPLTVVSTVWRYKKLCSYDDPDSLVEEIDARMKKVVMKKKAMEKKRNDKMKTSTMHFLLNWNRKELGTSTIHFHLNK